MQMTTHKQESMFCPKPSCIYHFEIYTHISLSLREDSVYVCTNSQNNRTICTFFLMHFLFFVIWEIIYSTEHTHTIICFPLLFSYIVLAKVPRTFSQINFIRAVCWKPTFIIFLLIFMVRNISPEIYTFAIATIYSNFITIANH